MTNPTDKCVVCGGTEAEHAESHHLFTLKYGELVTQDQRAKEQPQQITVPSQGVPLGRLIEVLVTKKLLTLDDALYIAELGPRPNLEKYEETPQW